MADRIPVTTDSKGWFAARFARLSTGLKMLLIFSAALFPLALAAPAAGPIMVWGLTGGLMLAGIGVVAGLGIGMLLVALFEVPLLLTIQTSEDARHYTGLPVLIAVPELLTPTEARSLPRRRRLLLAAGVIATIVSIPLLALALRLTHVFEILTQSRGAA